LPQSITAADGTKVNYSYFSDGSKFRAVSDNGEKLIYAGSLRLKAKNYNAVPESFAIAGGRVKYDNGSWHTEYYITDHLGSVRAVTDASGNVLATFDYTPYGELLAATDNTATGTDHQFTGKEQQSKLGVSELYDSQARFMGTDGRFTSIDPLAEKYYHLSPYAYCTGDPVNFVDPDGMKIEFRKDVPEWVKQRYYATIEYMKETGTYDLVFKELEESKDFVVYIDYVENNEIGYKPKENTIYWNPNVFIETTNGIYIFPATILAHEGVHALQDMTIDDENDGAYMELLNQQDAEYDNPLEREVIINYEWKIARMHGDIKESEVTRKEHKANKIFLYNTKKCYTAAEDYRELLLDLFVKTQTGVIIQ
jgi:RHS repeat-associated protein